MKRRKGRSPVKAGRKPRRACPCGKDCFGTKEAAIGHAARYLRENGQDDEYGYYRAYRCPRSSWWHLTHQRNR